MSSSRLIASSTLTSSARPTTTTIMELWLPKLNELLCTHPRLVLHDHLHYPGSSDPFHECRVARSRIVLKEAKAPYTEYAILPQNKPEWYAPRPSPAPRRFVSLDRCPCRIETLQHLQVPTMTYSGPKVVPTNPSPESFKLTEPLILLEFIADLSLSVKLYANDPLQRTQIRVFIHTFSNKFLDQWYAFLGETLTIYGT